jgi:SAM-dependent methyltransferase
MGGVLRPGGTLVDVGCGQGLMLALLAETAAASQFGDWPVGPPPPVFDRLVGIEMRRSVAALARQALGDDATIVEGDARTHVPTNCRAVLFFDVLHMMPADDQEGLLRRMAGSLEPDGVIVVREADAAAGWRFTAVRAGNKLKALLFGHWRQRFQFRTADEWKDCFTAAGFDVDARGAGEGTPFGNVLFILTRSLRASA